MLIFQMVFVWAEEREEINPRVKKLSAVNERLRRGEDKNEVKNQNEEDLVLLLKNNIYKQER